MHELEIEKHIVSLFSLTEDSHQSSDIKEEQKKEDEYIKIYENNIHTVLGYYAYFIWYIYVYYKNSAGPDLAVDLMKKYISESFESAQLQSELTYMPHQQIIKNTTGSERKLAVAAFHSELVLELYYHIQALTVGIQTIENATGQSLTFQNPPSTKGTQS